MSEAMEYRGVDRIRRRLDGVRSLQWAVRAAVGAVTLAALAGGAVVVGAMLMGYWPGQPPAMVRWGLLGAILLAAAAGLAVLAAGLVRGKLGYAQAARLVEQAGGGMENYLINAVLLAQDARPNSPDLVQAAIAEAAGKAGGIDPIACVPMRALKRWGLAAGVVAAAGMAFAMFQPEAMGRGLKAVLTPERWVGPVNRIRLVSMQPEGDVTVFAGASLEVEAVVAEAGEGALAGELVMDDGTTRSMEGAQGLKRFAYQFKSVQEDVRYSVRIGGSRWPTDREYYSVKVIRRVEVEGIERWYEYPAYTQMAATTAGGKDGKIEGPVGTVVRLRVSLDRAVPAASLQIKGGVLERMDRVGDGRTFTGSVMVDGDGAYRIALQDGEGRVVQEIPEAEQAGGTQAGWFAIAGQADPPPKVDIVSPSVDISAPPGGKVAVAIRASDKYGLADVALTAGREGEQAVTVKQWKYAAGARKDKALERFEYVVPAGLPADGSVAILCQATAGDHREVARLKLGPQRSLSRQVRIVVQEAAKIKAEQAKRYEELYRRLAALLRAQELKRVDTELCRRKLGDLAAVQGAGRGIVQGQKEILKELVDLRDRFPFDKALEGIRRGVASIADSPAPVAVQQAQGVAELGQFAQRGRACGPLAATQDQILDALRTLLAVMPTAAGREGEKTGKRGEDLPPDAAEKLRKLAEGLRELVKEERKAIEAAQRLNKSPVDAFEQGQEQEKALEALKAVQDKWEKFLNEAVTDFSKLAQQDFSNPSLMKELLSVKSDVTMAKDALEKKATEIATALEDNGIENAKTLTTNIEKWLSDEPDRVKWAMEAPAGGQEKVEAAELPTELEDLVGDLLEEEEDLFDEMEDISSKYAASFDKGAGWDAMDGPISSMNAQGVTGNQLPNNSEIQGRSGEGRSGKSSGEFVEDKAVGKGGRKTPTRLTEEPFQKGHVKDVSTETPGGATGGGKVSGSGEEGLEGPVPPAVKEKMGLLAGKQASLINKAERVKGTLKPGDYRNFEMEKMITLMGRVKKDLKNDYRNSLREKKTLLSEMRQSGLLLTGGVQVEADASAEMPKYVRDKVADAQKDKAPEGFQDVMQQFYRRLGEGEK